MADLLKGLFGAQKPVTTPAGDDDFADFAGAPDPSPASISPITANTVSGQGALPTGSSPIVYTKWYRVWERTQPSDFIAEALILPFIIIVVGLHAWGRKTNRRKAKGWIDAHASDLQKEYASVGFGAQKSPSVDEVQASGLANASKDSAGMDLLKEKTAAEYHGYATGRQNVAFLDIKVALYKRYNPATLMVEAAMGFFFDSIPMPEEKITATMYAFDGREGETVPAKSQEQLDAIQAQAKTKSSVYDPFVWAVVHKEQMRSLRDSRYDLSLTSTKDNAKLPVFATVMSESAEITDLLLTPDLIKAVETAGDAFEALIITDQPLDKPSSLGDVKPKKRITLMLRVPSGSSASDYAPTLPIFRYYLRLPDQLTSTARFRPEIRRKINAAREEEQRKLKKIDEVEKAEDRKKEADKAKKEIRDNRLKGLSAEEQRKFLEKERDRNNKKQEKRMTKKA